VREPLDANLEIAKFIAAHYRRVEQIGDYVILEREQ
jgi:sporulation protein YlmC with PRC-barrel domain